MASFLTEPTNEGCSRDCGPNAAFSCASVILIYRTALIWPQIAATDLNAAQPITGQRSSHHSLVGVSYNERAKWLANRE